jgi:hypothetical protein
VSRIDGDSPTGQITNDGTGEMQLQAIPAANSHLINWTAPEEVVLSNPRSFNPVATGFATFDNVIITANFGDGLLPTKQIDASAGIFGAIEFYYINSVGEEQFFQLRNLVPGGIYTNLTCGYIITSVLSGAPNLSTRSC